MNFIKRRKFVFLLIAVLLIISNSNSSAIVQMVPMQQIGEDAIGDGGSLGFDILSTYAASFDGLLMLTVVYAEVGEWELFSNTTIRNLNGDLYLIMVYTTPNENYISMVDATSLENDSLNTNDSSYFSYDETWRVHTNFTELTFFVDWIDIGGEGPIDLVFWTGRPLDNPDKLPDTGHLSFDGVKNVNTTGYLDDPVITTTTTIKEPTDQPSINDPPSQTNITVSEDEGDEKTSSNHTDTPDVQVDAQLTDLVPISNTFAIGIIMIIIVHRKTQKR